jgi:class 3 adenylate cyclase
LFGLWLAAGVARPISSLRDGVRQIGEGDFSVAMPATGVKEVVHLADSFNQLGRQLTEYIEKRDFIRDTFGRYVTQEVVKKLLESKEALELGGETREVSIIMSDIRGFTALTADMQPEEVITFLNRYLGKMIEILTDYRAVIDEIVGDGLLAFFGAPEPMEDHPVRAVACALQMQAAMDEVNFLNAADGMPHLEMGVGVDTGSVVVGNIGSEKRAKYSVVGSHVNFTFRIESYAVGGQVLISASTYQKVRDLIKVGDIIQAEMKGVPEPVTLYEVMGIGGPYDIHLKERCEILVPLPEKVQVHLQRIQEKIVTGVATTAWITDICETEAVVVYEGELREWEDVRLHLLDENAVEIPGKIYGKVISIREAGDRLRKADIRFTSVSPEIYPFIQKAIGGAKADN